jgi:hypothetical protein
MTDTISLNDMRDHIDQLINELRSTRYPEDDDFHVYWIDEAEEACAFTDDWSPVEIHIPKVRSLDDYATCLHELGHVYGRDQKSPDSTTRELGAWQWAREHALAWTEEMERIAADCLKRAERGC